MGLKTLDLQQSMRLAAKYAIKFAPHKTARSQKELETACRKIGFPLALKVISSKITHKTEAGGVLTGITSLAQARKTYARMAKIPGFSGVVAQEMVKGTEIIIGGKRDVQFGPTVLVGLGGVFVEVFKDYAIGICPLTPRNAGEMLESLRAYPILAGYRGKKGADLKKLGETILKVSRLMMKEKRVEELDLNPVVASEKRLLAVDARAVVHEKQPFRRLGATIIPFTRG